MQIASARSFLPIYNFEAWIIIFSLNCNCICELQWITMDYVNYNWPNCSHKFPCIPHYFCELESISSIFHKYIFYNRYIIHGFSALSTPCATSILSFHCTPFLHIVLQVFEQVWDEVQFGHELVQQSQDVCVYRYSYEYTPVVAVILCATISQAYEVKVNCQGRVSY